MIAYRQVLAVPGAVRLFASAVVARVPQGMTSLALLLLVRDATHSYALAGLAVGIEALMTAVCAPVMGRLVDRRGRRYVLGRCAAGYAVSLSLIALGADVGVPGFALVVLSGVAGASLPPIAASLRALLPGVFAEPGLRERAYALDSVAQELIWISGPLLVALVITFVSPGVALLLIGAECMLGTLLFLRSPLADDGHPRDRPARRRAALASRPLRALLVPIALNGSALGATEVGLPALALHTGSRSATGLLLAVWSFGSLSGGLMYGSLRWRAPLDVRYGALLAAAALSVAPLIFARSVAAGIPFAVLAGVAIAPVFSCQYALVGESILPGSETEAFTWVSAALVAGIAGGSAAGGALVSAAGFSAPFVFAFAITAVAAAAAFSIRLFGALRVGAVVCE